MAKKGMIEREKKRQKLVLKYQQKRAEVKALLHELQTICKQPNDAKSSKTQGTARSEQFAASVRLEQFPRNSSKIRLKNRCSVTGRPKGFYRDFGLSRHVLREMAYEGLLPGVTKASW
jgi:small subunit ribosomal protein S14